jgi:hypothetical protein
MEMIELLNRDQLIQLAGLAAGADQQFVMIKQNLPEQDTPPILMPPILVSRMVNKEEEEFVMSSTGLYQKRN